jgi:hypothetical protein
VTAATTAPTSPIKVKGNWAPVSYGVRHNIPEGLGTRTVRCVVGPGVRLRATESDRAVPPLAYIVNRLLAALNNKTERASIRKDFLDWRRPFLPAERVPV